MISNNHCPKKKGELLQKDLNDGCILYDEGKSQMYILNITAAYVWIYCDGKHTLEHITQEIASSCDTTFEYALKNVTDTIIIFNENGLLEQTSL